MAKGFGGRPTGGVGMNTNMLKQAQKMQADILKMQQQLETRTYEAAAGGGVVTATVTGKKLLQNLVIDREAVDLDDLEMLQDLIVVAVNMAIYAAEEDANNAMQRVTGGLGLPF